MKLVVSVLVFALALGVAFAQPTYKFLLAPQPLVDTTTNEPIANTDRLIVRFRIGSNATFDISTYELVWSGTATDGGAPTDPTSVNVEVAPSRCAPPTMGFTTAPTPSTVTLGTTTTVYSVCEWAEECDLYVQLYPTTASQVITSLTVRLQKKADTRVVVYNVNENFVSRFQRQTWAFASGAVTEWHVYRVRAQAEANPPSSTEILPVSIGVQVVSLETPNADPSANVFVHPNGFTDQPAGNCGANQEVLQTSTSQFFVATNNIQFPCADDHAGPSNAVGRKPLRQNRYFVVKSPANFPAKHYGIVFDFKRTQDMHSLTFPSVQTIVNVPANTIKHISIPAPSYNPATSTATLEYTFNINNNINGVVGNTLHYAYGTFTVPNPLAGGIGEYSYCRSQTGSVTVTGNTPASLTLVPCLFDDTNKMWHLTVWFRTPEIFNATSGGLVVGLLNVRGVTVADLQTTAATLNTEITAATGNSVSNWRLAASAGTSAGAATVRNQFALLRTRTNSGATFKAYRAAIGDCDGAIPVTFPNGGRPSWLMCNFRRGPVSQENTEVVVSANAGSVVANFSVVPATIPLQNYETPVEWHDDGAIVVLDVFNATENTDIVIRAPTVDLPTASGGLRYKWVWGAPANRVKTMGCEISASWIPVSGCTAVDTTTVCRITLPCPGYSPMAVIVENQLTDVYLNGTVRLERTRTITSFTYSSVTLATQTINSVEDGQIVELTNTAVRGATYTISWPDGVPAGAWQIRAFVDCLNAEYLLSDTYTLQVCTPGSLNNGECVFRFPNERKWATGRNVRFYVTGFGATRMSIRATDANCPSSVGTPLSFCSAYGFGDLFTVSTPVVDETRRVFFGIASNITISQSQQCRNTYVAIACDKNILACGTTGIPLPKRFCAEDCYNWFAGNCTTAGQSALITQISSFANLYCEALPPCGYATPGVLLVNIPGQTAPSPSGAPTPGGANPNPGGNTKPPAAAPSAAGSLVPSLVMLLVALVAIAFRA